MTNKQPKVLLYDIETLPNKGYFFQCYDARGNNINTDFIIKERSIISIAYKWYNVGTEADVISIADFPKEFKKDPHNDRKVLEKFAKVLDDADFIVGHYSDKFDNKFIQARTMINKLPPLKMPTEVDTHKLLKKHFLLNANRLGYVGKLLGLGGKNPMGIDDWLGCANGDIDSVRKMTEYNQQDVVLLEQIFKQILPYVKHKIDFTILHNKEEVGIACTGCGSTHFKRNGRKVLSKSVCQNFQCLECGKQFYDRSIPYVSSL